MFTLLHYLNSIVGGSIVKPIWQKEIDAFAMTIVITIKTLMMVGLMTPIVDIIILSQRLLLEHTNLQVKVIGNKILIIFLPVCLNNCVKSC